MKNIQGITTATYRMVLFDGTQFKLALSLDTMCTLDARISLAAYKRNPPQPR